MVSSRLKLFSSEKQKDLVSRENNKNAIVGRRRNSQRIHLVDYLADLDQAQAEMSRKNMD